MVLYCIMERTEIRTGQIITYEAPFHTEQEVNLEGNDLEEMYVKMKDTIIERMINFMKLGNGWRFRSIVKLVVHTVKYTPLKGSSYIPLPKYLITKNAIIKLKNEDDQCFKWAITRALNPKDKHPECIDKNLQEKAKEFDWSSIEFPVSLKHINKFE